MKLFHNPGSSVLPGYQDTDPFEGYSLYARQYTCDLVMTAANFVAVAFERKAPEIPPPEWTTMDEFLALNYQRVDICPSTKEYEARSLPIPRANRKRVKMMQCVKTERINWQVTFGLIDRYMYLIEKNKDRYQMTAIIEPDAVKTQDSEHDLNQYFSDHHPFPENKGKPD